MFTPNHRMIIVGAATAALAACAAQPESATAPTLGVEPSQEEISRYDISIPPSGEGLPPGGGSARKGAAVYTAKCESCHGTRGVGKPADALVGGIGTLATQSPVRTVGSYWPYATTLFDYVRRAMPLDRPLSLSNDEVYAVSAYVLYLNGIIREDAEMTAATLPGVRMPNRDGFVSEWPIRKR